MDTIRNEIEQRLLTIVDAYPDSDVKEAMKYSLLAGGKRIRPLLFIQTIRCYHKEYLDYLDIACAIEMIHTYSLIHDDLPGMDNDDMRRGLPTCHKQFGEATAILAGDSLLNEAMNVILQMSIEPMLKIEVLTILFNASGLHGMIFGQQLDINFENVQATVEELEKIHEHKTGALIRASLALGAVIVAKEDVSTWQKIGQNIGLAFQIQDDILDVIGDSKLLGKNTGSDVSNQKSTYVSLLGLEMSQKKVEDLFKEAIDALYGLQVNHELFLELIKLVKKRVR